MRYVYHAVPDKMIGSKLIPLNKMSGTMQPIRNKNLTKYEGRKEILERKIPLLDCLWNDVVQFLPLHPRKVFELQINLGILPEVPHYRFFEIDVQSLDPEKTVVFFKDAPGEENVSIKWLSDVDLSSIQDIPPATIAYYKTLIGTGELPFNYQFIPHIVHKGSIDVSKARTVTL